MAKQTSSAQFWSMRWNARMAVSATIHLLHSLAILVLTLFVPGRPGTWLTSIWGVGAFFSAMGLLLVLRVGSYEGTTDEEVGELVRRGYWVATSIYLSLLAASLFFITRG